MSADMNATDASGSAPMRTFVRLLIGVVIAVPLMALLLLAGAVGDAGQVGASGDQRGIGVLGAGLDGPA